MNHTIRMPRRLYSSSIFKSDNKKARCYISKVTDPWINLAFEEKLFRQKDGAEYTLLLWRNSPCVIIGRNQNPWTECRHSLMAQDGIPLVRRRSGGGTVYHDLGNSNYSIMMPRPVFQRSTSVSLVCRALHQLDIPAKVNDRYDIVIDEAKVSGSAYKLINEKAYHHGTMLIDSDLNALGKYLKPVEKNIVTRGVASVRSKVTRLRDHSFTIDHSPFCDEVAKEFASSHSIDDLEILNFTLSDFEKDSDLVQFYDEIKADDWIYGQSPQFEHNLSTTIGSGKLDLTLTIHRGKITQVHFETSLEKPRDNVHFLEKHLIGEWYHNIGSNPHLSLEQVAVLEWIKSEIAK